jgi:hypothetical protein
MTSARGLFVSGGDRVGRVSPRGLRRGGSTAARAGLSGPRWRLPSTSERQYQHGSCPSGRPSGLSSHAPPRLPGLGVPHELDIRSHLVPRTRGQDGERDAPGVEVDGALRMPGRGGAAFALPLAGCAVELDDRQPPPGRGDRVALMCACAFSRTSSSSRAACQVARSTTGGLPGRLPPALPGVVVMVSSVMCRAGQRRRTTLTRRDSRPGRNSSPRRGRPRPCSYGQCCPVGVRRAPGVECVDRGSPLRAGAWPISGSRSGPSGWRRARLDDSVRRRQGARA